MNREIIKSELQYKAVRSSGAGGQNVNKVATKVQIQFAFWDSAGLSNSEKELIKEKLTHRLTKENLLIIDCSETRSQLKNKQLATQKLFNELEYALKKEKKRIATKIPKSAIKKRLKEKKHLAEKKQNRKFKF